MLPASKKCLPSEISKLVKTSDSCVFILLTNGNVSCGYLIPTPLLQLDMCLDIDHLLVFFVLRYLEPVASRLNKIGRTAYSLESLDFELIQLVVKGFELVFHVLNKRDEWLERRTVAETS